MPPDYATRLYLEHESQLADEIFLKSCPIPIHRLRELAEADMEGKAMILPVKPGEYIYLISLDSEIVPCRVGNIAAEEWGMSFEGAVEGFGPYRTGPNEKVFFSRESAENALKTCMGKEKSNELNIT